MTRLLQSGALIALLASALTALRRVGAMPVGVLSFADLGWWLRSTSPEDAVVACLRVIALGCVAWLLAGSLLYALARVSRVPGAISAVEWSLPPALRRVLDRGLAAALAGSAAIAAPAAAIEPPAWPLPPVMEPGEEPAAALPGPAATGAVQMGDAPVRPSPAEGSPAIAPGPGPMILPAVPFHAGSGATASDAGARGFGVHEVSPGDSLWSIAAAAAARELGRPASEIHPEQIRGRWLLLIADNRAHLRSGDPDLIFPGEQVRLRAADDGPRVRRRTADDGSPPRRRADTSESSRASTSTAPAATRSAPAAHSGGLEAAPAAGPPAAGQAASPYALPVDRALLSRELMSRPHHDYPAWDLPLPVGTEVSAVHGGRVVAVTSSASRCGNGAVVDGHDGHRYTYCHADRVLLAAGEQVLAGQVILLSGSTGNSTGPHLHLGIATPSGRAICPQPLLQAWHDGSQAAPSELTTTDCV